MGALSLAILTMCGLGSLGNKASFHPPPVGLAQCYDQHSVREPTIVRCDSPFNFEGIMEDQRRVEGDEVYGDKVIGDKVGRDKHGLSGAEINQIIETLLKYFPRGHLQPSRLDSTLNLFYQYHEQLREWKELHDSLDDLIKAFDPYYVLVQTSDMTRKVSSRKKLRALWGPVSRQVDALLVFVNNANYINQPQVLGDGSRKGVVQVDSLNELRRHISELLEARAYPTFQQCLLFKYLNVDIDWWQEIYKLAGEFEHVIKQQMHLADKRLRDTATEIYRLLR